MLIASAGDERAAFAYIVSKRAFTGNWEYQLDSAIYTSPPTLNWSGAALIDRDGKLIGIGSLIVREATDGEPKIPGNVFVPIDLLKPILTDLVREGHRTGPARPWLGVSADEIQGRVLVTRVSPDGPADQAGLQPGDIILAVGSDVVRSQSEFYQRLWTRGSAGDEITAEGAAGHRRARRQGALDRPAAVLPAEVDDLAGRRRDRRRGMRAGGLVAPDGRHTLQ